VFIPNNHWKDPQPEFEVVKEATTGQTGTRRIKEEANEWDG
jgi:hypothetical protein